MKPNNFLTIVKSPFRCIGNKFWGAVQIRSLLLTALTLLLFIFAGCGKDDKGNEDTTVAVTGVSVSKATLTLVKGDTETLTATVLPTDATNTTVTWTSSGTTVATVNNNGLVTAVAEGAATITVTTEDGNKTATCVVTVEAVAVAVTDVSLNKTTLTLVKGDTETLVATVLPTDATNTTVTWTSSSTTVATVSNNGLVTAVAEGVATITVTTEDGNKTAACEVTVIPESRWARSNIVWIEDNNYSSGGYLSFAITPEDNAEIPADVQGVFFRWGSLVAISPVGSYASSRILFSPSGNKSYDWSAIPYVNETSGLFGDYETDSDDFATYNDGTGFNSTANRGDICRYISAKGWVNGDWRMPTSKEFIDLAVTGAIASDGSIWSNITSVPDEGDNANGFYQPESGVFLGAGVKANDNTANPAKGVIFFPASGTRQISSGVLYQAGDRGYIWSGSSATAQMATTPMIYTGGMFHLETYRQYAAAIRCIREKTE